MPEQNRYAARKAEGLCVSCGSEPARPERVRCMACAERASADAALKRRRARRKGLCEACMSARAVPGRGRRCDACADKYLARQLERERQARRREQGSQP